MSRTFNLFASLLLVLFPLTGISQGVTTSWTNAAGGSWSVGGNWGSGSPGPADTARFNATALGQTTVMDLGGSTTILGYEIFGNTTNGSHTLDLGSSTLNMTNMELAVNDTASTSYGHLSLDGTAGSTLNITGTLDLATGRNQRADMVVAPAVELNIGVNPTTRGSLIITNDSSASHATNIASLTPGNTFNAYLTNLTIGREVSNGDPFDSVATLNLSNVTSGIIDVSGDVLIGEGFAASGVLNVTDDTDMKIGVNASTRGSLRIASGDAKRAVHTPSTMTVGTGSFEAYLSELTVAHATRMSNWLNVNNVSATGTLDLTSVTDGFVDVDGTIRVGTVRSGFGNATGSGVTPVSNDPDYSPRSIGLMRVGAIDVTTTDLIVGDVENRARIDGVLGDIGQGTLEMYSTQFSVTGDVTIDGYDVANAGQIAIEVENVSSGLLLSNSSTLTVGNGSIDITFLAPENEFGGDYFGLRWEGDHTAELLGLGSKITWDDTALTALGYDPVSIYFSEGFTFVGLYIQPIPEPNTGIMMALGLVALLRRRNKKLRASCDVCV